MSICKGNYEKTFLLKVNRFMPHRRACLKSSCAQWVSWWKKRWDRNLPKLIKRGQTHNLVSKSHKSQGHNQDIMNSIITCLTLGIGNLVSDTSITDSKHILFWASVFFTYSRINQYDGLQVFRLVSLLPKS